MINRLLLLTTFTCVCYLLPAQTSVDSLFNVLKNALPEKERIDIYNKLSKKTHATNPDTSLYYANCARELASNINYTDGIIISLNNLTRHYLSISMFDTVLVLSSRAIELCQKNGSKRMFAQCYLAKGSVFEYLNSVDSANYYFTRAVEHAKDDPDKVTLADILNSQANLLKQSSDYEKALDNYLKALEIYRLSGDRVMEAIVTSNIGNIYIIREQYELALNQFSEALALNTKLNNLAAMAMDYNNLGLIYMYLNRFDKSIESHFKSIEINETLGRKGDLVKCYYNLGTIYTSIKDYDKAFDNHKHSLELSNEIGFDLGVLYNTFGIGLIYSKMNNRTQAEKYLKESLQLSLVYKTPEVRMNSLLELYYLNRRLAYYEQALDFHEQYYALKDSIFTSEREKTVTELQTKYETQKKETEIGELKHKEEVNQLTMRLVILIVIILIFGVVALIFYYQKQKVFHRQKLTIQQQEIDKMQMIENSNKQELTSKALMLAKSEEIILQFKNEIEQVLPKADPNTSSELRAILRRAQWTENGKEQWNDFISRFDELNNGFIGKLTKSYPSLSPVELRLCALLRLQLSTKDIAEMSSRSIRTIENSRTSIRKKISLNSNDNLTTFLMSV